MTDEATTDDGRTTFDITTPADAAPADIWVDEFFTNSYNDRRAALAGDTYDAKGIIKFDWDTTHHKFDGQNKQWVVDADALDELETRLEAEGFACDFDESDGREQTGLFEAHSYAREGDRFAVEYEQKNGEGTNTKSGEVIAVTHNSGWDDKPRIEFVRSDGQMMYVQFDKTGKVALYTGGSHAPFVGSVRALTFDTDADRPIESPDTDEAADEADTASETVSLPWGN